MEFYQEEPNKLWWKDDDIGGSFLWQTNTRVESDVHVVALALTMSTRRNTISMFKLNN